jgi:hypothetical protein
MSAANVAGMTGEVKRPQCEAGARRSHGEKCVL